MRNNAPVAVKPVWPAMAVAMAGMVFPAAAETRTVFDHGNPTVLEQLMLEMVNRARADPAAEAVRLGIDLNSGLTPGTIGTAPKPPLALHPFLIGSARAHSQWMLDTGVFSHTGVDGSDAGERMADAGYLFASPWTWGENIAWGGSTGSIDTTQQTMARHDGLFRSPGHRTNLCNPGFSQIGIGILAGTFNGYRAVMATQNFARSGAYPQPLALGVVFTDRDGDGFYDPGEGEPDVRVSPAGEPWEAITSDSGGYAVPYSAGSGSLNVVFSGGAALISETRTVQKTGTNVKLDLVVSAPPPPPLPPPPPPVAEIVVQQPRGSNLVDGRAQRGFGTTVVRTKGPTRVFTIRNTGTAILDGIAVTRHGTHARDFLVTQPGQTKLAPGARTTFKVTFRPQGKGTRRASIRIRSTDADENPFDIKLTGMAAAP